MPNYTKDVIIQIGEIINSLRNALDGVTLPRRGIVFINPFTIKQSIP